MHKRGRRTLLLFLLASPFAAAPVSPAPAQRAAPTAKAAWRAYASQDGRFTVDLPGNPVVKAVSYETPIGRLRFTFHLVTIGDAAYMVAYSDYPQDAIRRYTVDHILKNVRQGALFPLQGKLVSERKIEVGGYPARYIAIDGVNHGTAVARARMVLAGRRLYQVLVAMPGAQANSATVTRFLTSFRITAAQGPFTYKPEARRR